MESRKEKLEDLDFQIIFENPGEVRLVESSWNALLNMVNFIFIKKISVLTPQIIESDICEMLEYAKENDPSKLPLGAQHGRSIIPFYITDSVTNEVKTLCKLKRKIKYSQLVFPVVFDNKTGEVYYLHETPAWGAMYYPKLRLLAETLAYPDKQVSQEAIDGSGSHMVEKILKACVIMFSICIVLIMLLALLRGFLS